MLPQYRQDLPFWLYSSRVNLKVEIDDVTYFIETETDLLQLADLPQAGDRLFGVVVLTVTFPLPWRDQSHALVISNGARRDPGRVR